MFLFDFNRKLQPHSVVKKTKIPNLTLSAKVEHICSISIEQIKKIGKDK